MTKDVTALTIRCTTCRSEFTDEQTRGVSACPECGATGIPMSIADDVTIRINWHELRILTIWASNYATAHCDRGSREALAAILHALALQYPDKSALTLAGEIGELKRAIDSGEIEGVSNLETNVRDLLDKGCPVCFALPDQACVTPQGKARPDHAKRKREAAR